MASKRAKAQCPRCGKIVTVLIGGTFMAHLPRHGYASIPDYCDGSGQRVSLRHRASAPGAASAPPGVPADGGAR